MKIKTVLELVTEEFLGKEIEVWISDFITGHYSLEEHEGYRTYPINVTITSVQEERDYDGRDFYLNFTHRNSEKYVSI